MYVTVSFDPKAKKVMSRTPETVKFNFSAIPKHEMDALCRSVIQCTKASFNNPAVVAEYEQWLIARYGKREGKKRFKKDMIAVGSKQK